MTTAVNHEDIMLYTSVSAAYEAVRAAQDRAKRLGREDLAGRLYGISRQLFTQMREISRAVYGDEPDAPQSG